MPHALILAMIACGSDALLRPVLKRPPAPAEVLAGLQPLPLDEVVTDLRLADDLDGDGSRDLVLSTTLWRMCGDDPSNGRVRALAAEDLSVIRERDSHKELDFDRTRSGASALLRGSGRGVPDELEYRAPDGWMADRGSRPHWRRGGPDLHPLGNALDLRFVGDLDGDGLEDLVLINAWAEDGSGPASDSAGRASMPGGAAALSARDGTLLWSAFGRRDHGGFGMEAHPAGDHNGDGTPDVAVLATPIADDRPQAHVAVLCGSDGIALRTLRLPDRWRIGRMEPTVDLDRDGLADFLVTNYEGASAVIGSKAGEALGLELPFQASWASSTAGIEAPDLGRLGAVVFGRVDEASGRRSIWTVDAATPSPHGDMLVPRKLRSVLPGEPPWGSTGATLTLLLGPAATPSVVLSGGSHRFFDGNGFSLFVVPLWP